MKNKNLRDSFLNAINGILYALRTERNIKIHFISTALVVILSFFYKLNRIEFTIVLIAVALVILCEMINSAIEQLVDIIVDVYHPKAKIIKDLSAGAVLVSAVFSIAVGYFVFFDRITESIAQIFYIIGL